MKFGAMGIAPGGADMNETESKSGRIELGIALGVGLFALAARLIYLAESRDNPLFDRLIVDAASYDKMARLLLEKKIWTPNFFFQPPFYPYFLYLVYYYAGPSIVGVKILQAVLGAMTCALTYLLGRRVFGRSEGLLAAAMTSLYGPMIFFETRLVATGWAAFWSVALLLIFLRAREKKNPLTFFILGLCGALAIVTRPTFAPFFLAACGWLILSFRHSGADGRDIGRLMSRTGLGMLLILIPVAIKNHQVTGRWSPLPASGGVNFYIGNNEDVCRTLQIRPSGAGWVDLSAIPDRAGVHDLEASQRYYYALSLAFARDHPMAFARNMALKALQIVNSRELPRNVDLYLFRQWSAVLAALTWKIGRFGFPFGLLFPFAVAGWVLRRREIPAPMALFLTLYPLAIVLFFVNSRYRIPVIPALATVAAAGAMSLIRIARARRWNRALIATACMAGAAVICAAPGTFCQEQVDYETELYYLLAKNRVRAGRFDEAMAYFRRARSLAPGNADIPAAMANAYYRMNDLDTAETACNEALRLNPNNPLAHEYMGAILSDQGRLEAADGHYAIALRLNPGGGSVYYNRGIVLARMGRIEEAIEHFTDALRLDPENPAAHYNLALNLEKAGRPREAIENYRRTLKWWPGFAEALRRLAWILATAEDASLRDGAEAVRLARRACELSRNQDPESLRALGAAYAEAGDFTLAVQTAERALALTGAPDQAELAGQIRKQLKLYRANEPWRSDASALDR